MALGRGNRKQFIKSLLLARDKFARNAVSKFQGVVIMHKGTVHFLAAIALVAAAAPVPAFADDVNFGDDSGRFSKDGECDDMRFDGAGMTDTLLIDSDILHDATDCRAAFNQGRLKYLGGHRRGTPASTSTTSAGRIQWGDDSSKYSKDGECDDKRFTGAGMTTTPLLDSDIQHDATDCRSAFNAGRLTLRP